MNEKGDLEQAFISYTSDEIRSSLTIEYKLAASSFLAAS
jgi:hypothetical protein